MTKNYYPELPVVDYHKTSIEMGVAIAALKAFDVSRQVKIAAYCIFRIESGNGKYGVNNNYIGAQADNNRWPDSLNQYIIGTAVKKENMTGKERRFLAFKDVSGSFAFLIDRILSRGLYVGGHCNVIADMDINDAQDWAVAYEKSWVYGSKTAKIPDSELRNILSIYKAGERVF
ncbi:hypothetical protein SAMN05192529_13136 [Arachidicoccus rhizosphaerae]|uniref:Uncharacterized protein n=1 Tax=Arachidicoccus rhizosphaerae TaxID=551991 RepID=A0A1H4CFZ9_9BACT|nr:hypothetical protein [Arachidicoccus rhizosphaerae]SEA59307.1 hypothetical protein SAMN05192529_13136 [Arachidicoccus rhizosphaerae]